jgi:hypothetical protein
VCHFPRQGIGGKERICEQKKSDIGVSIALSIGYVVTASG